MLSITLSENCENWQSSSIHKDIIDTFRFMFIIRYPYSHQYKRVIVIVYWSEYPDEVIHVFDSFVTQMCYYEKTLTVCPLRGDWFLLFPCRCGSTPWRNIYRTTLTTSIPARWNTHSPRILCRACPCKKLWRYKHIFFHFYTPEVKRWTYYGMAFVRPSVRPSVCLSVRPSVSHIMSA